MSRVTVTRRTAIILSLFVWLVGIPIGHVVVPWAISTLTPRYGWEQGSPGFWNRMALIPIGAMVALLVWILATGISRLPDRIRLGLTPAALLTRGPYRYTRNPMYVAELGLWFGWALFFGSLGVLAGCIVVIVVLNFLILPREERGLETAFGSAYLQYKNEVPRWFAARRMRE